ncbi:MAG TPA: nucleoside hydrolase [Candidatus Acidoferrum sp.]|nr:nucleoside hydrolase [Candidatus Acidoferrum sp.]
MRYLFLDTDPGIDDAIAILTLLGDKEVTMCGMSAVGGNVKLHHTLNNLLCLCEAAGRTDIPVYAGAPGPLFGALNDAAEVHGAAGLGGICLAAPEKKPEAEDAAEGIYRAAKAHPGQLSLMAIGPLTNVAKALLAHPDLGELLCEIFIMGGAIVGGNATLQSEFNIYVDPEAARIVFESGIKLTMAPLEIANSMPITLEELASLRPLGRAGTLAAEIGEAGIEVAKRYGREGGWPIYDAVTAVCWLRPDLFEMKDFNVVIETRGSKTRGRTVVDWYGFTKKPTNCAIPVSGDRDGYVKVLRENIGNLN